MTYDKVANEKLQLKLQERRSMEWKVFWSILIQMVFLYIPFPKMAISNKLMETKISAIDIARIKPPTPPEEQKKEEEKKVEKKKVLAKIVPQAPNEEIQAVTMDDEEIELVYDADEIPIEAPDAPTDAPLRVGGDVKAPIIKKKVDPTYPEIARRTRIEGMVILEAIITKSGKVTEVKVIKSLNSFCDEAAMEAVKQWEFEPGTQNDIPVDVIMNLTVIFQIN